jgi:enoyl-CoA hydratase
MSTIMYHEEDNVAILTINRPEVLNALNTRVLSELSTTIQAIDIQRVRCLIITGSGSKAFGAGADISEMLNLDEKSAWAFSKMGNDIFRNIEELPIPVIAAVNGYALGGGCELAMCCDIRLASENAIFGQPETGLGITPGFGGTQRLMRLIPLGKAKEMIYATTKINASEAYTLGLVNAVYPIEKLMPAALKLAKRIAKNAPIAVRASKKAMNDGLQTDIENAIEIEERLFGSCFTSEDQKNGMTAFLEKRKPSFLNK